MLLWASVIGQNLFLVNDWIAAGSCETCIASDTIQAVGRVKRKGPRLSR